MFMKSYSCISVPNLRIFTAYMYYRNTVMKHHELVTSSVEKSLSDGRKKTTLLVGR